MRSTLVIDTPDKCKNCPLSYWGIDGLNCKPLRKMIEDDKPDWCPLRPLPQKRETWNEMEFEVSEYAVGWNACIDEIIGDTE